VGILVTTETGQVTLSDGDSSCRDSGLLEPSWRISVAFISSKMSQFTYFSLQLGQSDWSGRDVLDFGGNVGNILRDPNSTID